MCTVSCQQTLAFLVLMADAMQWQVGCPLLSYSDRLTQQEPTWQGGGGGGGVVNGNTRAAGSRLTFLTFSAALSRSCSALCTAASADLKRFSAASMRTFGLADWAFCFANMSASNTTPHAMYMTVRLQVWLMWLQKRSCPIYIQMNWVHYALAHRLK